MPETIPIGTAMPAARPTRISVPTMALAMPPPGSPTGFGIWVKNARLSAGSPCPITKNRMNPSGIRARATEAAQKQTTAPETALRRRRFQDTPSTGRDGDRTDRARRPLRPDAPDQQARQRVDRDRDEEQHQTDLDQGIEVERVRRLGELVGDDGGHGVLRREQRQGRL